MPTHMPGTRSAAILVTLSYPYGHGEPFLEAEIPRLCSVFDDVFIIPEKRRESIRPVPKNAHVVAAAARETRRDRSQLIFSGIWQALRRPEVVWTELRSRGLRVLHPVAMQRLLSTLAVGRRISETAGEIVSALQPGCAVAAYSYWLGRGAWAVAEMKRMMPWVHAVARAHGGDLYEGRHPPAYLPLRMPLLQSLDEIHLISKHGHAYLTRFAPEFADKYRLSPLAVDGPGGVTPPSNDGGLRVLSCSALVEVKRVALLAEGLMAFARRRPEQSIYWTHIGGGPLQQDLNDVCADTPPNLHIQLTGSVPVADVLRFYRENMVDVFVNVSTAEGLPVSIMEAQSAGVPVIATAVNGTPEVVSDRDGLLVPRDLHPEVLADAFDDVCSRRDVWDTKRSLSRDAWLARGSADEVYLAFARKLHAACLCSIEDLGAVA